jgi:hypothetical protein
MHLIKQVVRKLVKPVLRLLKHIKGETLIRLSETAGSFYRLNTPITFEGDFSIAAGIVTSQQGSQIHVLDSTSDLLLKLIILETTGVVRLFVGNGVNWVVPSLAGTTDVRDGKYHYIEGTKEGYVYKIFVDGILEGQTTTSTPVTPSLSMFGRRSSGISYNQIVSDVKLTDLTDINNNLEFKLNKLTGNYELPVNITYLSNLVSNSDFSNGQTGWDSWNGGSRSVSNNVLTIYGEGATLASEAQELNLVQDTFYEVNLEFNVVTGAGRIDLDGIVGYSSGSGFITGGDVTKTGWKKYTVRGVYDSGWSDIAIFALGTNSVVQVREISVKAISNYVTYENIPESARDTYKVFDDTLLGRERIPQPIYFLDFWSSTNDASTANKISNNKFYDTAGWYSPRSEGTISVVSNKLRATADTTATFGSGTELTGLVIGEVYVISAYAASNNVSAEVRLRVVSQPDLLGTTFEKVGFGSVSVNDKFTATATTMYLGTIITGHNYNDYVDINAGIRFIKEGAATNTFDTAAVAGMYTGDVGLTGLPIQVSYSITADTTNVDIRNSNASSGTAPNIVTIQDNTTDTGVVNYTATESGIYLRVDGVSNGNAINSLSVKERIEIATLYLRDVMIKLSAEVGSFYKLDTDWVAQGDYSIEQYVYFKGDFISLTGNVSNSSSRVGIYGHGGIFWRPDSGNDTVTTNTGLVPANKLSLIKVERIGNVGRIYINNALVYTHTVSTSNVVVNANGNSGGSTTSGLLSKLKLTDLTDIDNNLEFRLNKLTGNYELPHNSVSGGERAINGDFTTDINGWTSSTSSAETSWDNGTLKVEASGGAQGAYQTFTTIVGREYFAVAQSTSASTDHLIRLGDGPVPDAGLVDSVTQSVPSQHSVSFVAISTTSYLYLRCSVLGTVNWDDVSFRAGSPDNFITYENIPESARDTYNLIGDAYVGSERVTNGGFTTDTNWVKGTGWTISGGKASNAANTETTYITQLGANINIGDLYTAKYTASNYSGTDEFGFSSSIFQNGKLSGNGTFDQDHIAIGVDLRLFGRETHSFQLDNVSVREKMYIAQ